MTSAPDRARRLRIHYTAVDDNIDELKGCIASGQDVNAQEGQGWTPLHFTANMGNVDIARILLASGADVTITNSNGETALDLAVTTPEPGGAEIAKDVFLHGGDPHHKDEYGNDAIGYLKLVDPTPEVDEMLKFFHEHGVE